MAENPTSSRSETSDATAASTPETREEMASKLVDRFALWSGVAGLIPVPLVDVATVGGLQIQMVRRISQIYDVDFSENRGKALIASLAGSLIPATSGIGAASMLKAVPIIESPYRPTPAARPTDSAHSITTASLGSSIFDR